MMGRAGAICSGLPLGCPAGCGTPLFRKPRNCSALDRPGNANAPLFRVVSGSCPVYKYNVLVAYHTGVVSGRQLHNHSGH
jgi:hypothetical protein